VRKTIIPILGLFAVVSFCDRQQTPAEVAKTYVLKGEVVSVDDQLKTAMISHEKVAGYMEAMTMEFSVPDDGERAKLKRGVKFTATLNVTQRASWLTDIKPKNVIVEQPAPATRRGTMINVPLSEAHS